MRRTSRSGGKWNYLYRAVDKHGKTVDFLMETSARRRARSQPPIEHEMLGVVAEISADLEHVRLVRLPGLPPELRWIGVDVIMW
jgi:hypothetical protein